MMGFCWSGECGNRPCWGDHYVPCCAGWVGPTVLLCIYGFCSMMRPIEPFLTEFLTGSYKNLTAEQVTRQVYPVWTYSNLVLLVPVLLVTDFLRYKPVIILQGITYVTTMLLILFGSGVHLAQLAFFCYSVAMAADTSLFYKGTDSAQHGASDEGSPDSEDFSIWAKSKTAAKHVGGKFRGFLLDCKECYSSVAMLFYCIWSATGTCGFYQVSAYIQLFWLHIQPGNFTAYNGGVDAFSTLTGAAASVAVGHMSVEWSVWGELVLGGFTFLVAGAIFLMDLTDNIWISYMCYSLFKTVYLQLSTICTFQIAKTLSRTRYALVFGMNSFVNQVLQSVLTAIVINSLQLCITLQYFVYASFFAAISLLFTVRGVYTVLHMKRPTGGNQAERATNLPEGSRP
ncbi:Thiamine transporter 2 [Collichthys lucidus]|uniref:Thiamine transporter 2 n=1 Tax=Collichthys lucidus TaxID=240159 RepID=A0A4V6AP36_COLLU|nr:Thiamine transporter 2 [Collichthys lucidus]